MKKVLLYPLWLRIWHWFNALLFIILIVSGISMHYSDTNELFLPFSIAMYTHNIAGVIISVIFLFYTIFNIVSGNYKHYIPTMQNMFERMFNQGKYYVYGVFMGHDHPYHTSEKLKFNPLQQLTYFGIMFFLMPVVIISGWLLMFPELAPANVMGMGGVWPMAILHIVVGFFLSVFMFGHIYLATHGETISANFKSMIDGYHHLHEEEPEKLIIKHDDVTEYTDDTDIVEAHEDYEVRKEEDIDYNPETKEIKKK
ncbi:MAG: cytochrome b/b6 domain-containing protein [Candidatus Kapabacteria bacterium]|nr:cytochrome b/b6 domain-containing protein [Ignavibacteriota bacterium]MCW5886258.1 cytochrome b/b6 domain-containing protein [Candidatus Kapabacteria bacterium]